MVNSEPIWPVAPVTRMFFIVFFGTYKSLAT